MDLSDYMYFKQDEALSKLSISTGCNRSTPSKRTSDRPMLYLAHNKRRRVEEMSEQLNKMNNSILYQLQNILKHKYLQNSRCYGNNKQISRMLFLI